ncbi:MAG: hypothetical protein AAGA80_19315 [Cyanobacteria bacterium P01_F01_bin.143]
MKNSGEVSRVAKSLVGTPYAFQQRSSEYGCDCLGLVLLIGWELELFNFDIKGYGKAVSHQLKDGIEKHCDTLPKIKAGALVLFEINNVPQHCGIITHYRGGWGLVHAYENVGQVREHSLINWWKDKICGVYALPNVNYD